MPAPVNRGPGGQRRDFPQPQADPITTCRGAFQRPPFDKFSGPTMGSRQRKVGPPSDVT